MKIKILTLLLFTFLAVGCNKNQIDNQQLNTEIHMSELSKDEISMASYFPSPYTHAGLRDEIFWALQFKFESSSNIEFTILDNDHPQKIKAMYYVWIQFSPQHERYEDGLALVTVGLSPKVVTYFTKSAVRKTLQDTTPATTIPEHILAEVKTLFTF